MIFDIYEQCDLFRIANCGRQKGLHEWLTQNRITFAYNAKQEIIAHKRAVEEGLGVVVPMQDESVGTNNLYFG
jgi:hypothetical protein